MKFNNHLENPYFRDLELRKTLRILDKLNEVKDIAEIPQGNETEKQIESAKARIMLLLMRDFDIDIESIRVIPYPVAFEYRKLQPDRSCRRSRKR